MNSGGSNAGPRDQPIFITLNSKKCMICRKWKREDSLTSSGSELVCNKYDDEAKLRKKSEKKNQSRN